MMSRNTLFLLTVAATLVASPARALMPQASTGGGGAATATVVRRCSNCGTASESERRMREKLLMKIDSLRWEIDNRRVSQSERERLSAELSRTVLALQRSLDESVGMEEAFAAKVELAPQAMRAARALVAVETAYRHRGYLGVTFDGPNARMESPTEFVVRFYQHPRIALVEPGSPAERAGILQDDTLLAVNGMDVLQREINWTKLLIPDSSIAMRVRRRGDAKDLKVIVAEAPDYYVLRQAPVVARAPRAPVAGRAEPVRVYVAEPMAPLPPMPRPAPGGAGGGSGWIVFEGIAGARVETISEGLGKAVGAKQGVLVVRVRPGTPAYRSGLRDGDVILSAAGRPVANVNLLRGIVAEGDGDEGVKLLIKRERKERDVTLRW